jgi:type II secretory pathway component PulL
MLGTGGQTMTLEEAIKHARDTAENRTDLCDECRDEHKQLAEWLEELKQLKTDEACVMPDYKTMYEEAAKQAEYWKQEAQRQTYEAVYLRAVKQTAEAFLGRKIGDDGT